MWSRRLDDGVLVRADRSAQQQEAFTATLLETRQLDTTTTISVSPSIHIIYIVTSDKLCRLVRRLCAVQRSASHVGSKVSVMTHGNSSCSQQRVSEAYVVGLNAHAHMRTSPKLFFYGTAVFLCCVLFLSFDFPIAHIYDSHRRLGTSGSRPGQVVQLAVLFRERQRVKNAVVL